jgi:Flp pilus assembly protein TadD
MKEDDQSSNGRLITYDVPGLRNLGLALKQQAKLEEVVAAFRTAIRIKPDVPEPHYDLGTVLKQQGKSAEAIAELHKARDKALRGSELAQLIEKGLTELDD